KRGLIARAEIAGCDTRQRVRELLREDRAKLQPHRGEVFLAAEPLRLEFADLPAAVDRLEHGGRREVAIQIRLEIRSGTGKQGDQDDLDEAPPAPVGPGDE